MAALQMSSYPAARANVRATVKTTAAIINLIIIIILDEIYAAIARWLTTLGETLLLTAQLLLKPHVSLSLYWSEVFSCQAQVFVGNETI